LHYGRWIAPLLLADEKVDVLGHDDVSGNDEMITAANLFEGSQKKIAMVRSI